MNRGFQFLIWGAGIRGKRVLARLERESVLAFIDSNEAMQGKETEGVPVLFYAAAREKWPEAVIVVSMRTGSMETVKFLKAQEDELFVLLTATPWEVFDYSIEELVGYAGLDMKGCGDRIAICGETLLSYLAYNFFLKQGMEAEIFTETNHGESGAGVYHDATELKGKKEYRFLLMQERYNAYLPEGAERYNFYNFTDAIPEYYHPELQEFKGIHQGERCFIVANGPSLRMEDLDTLHQNHVPCFGMNKIFMAFDQTEWRPEYYVTQDQAFVEQNAEFIEQLPLSHIIVGDTSKQKFSERILRYHLYEKLEEESILFSEDVSHICYEGGTITYSAIQFAAYMGFTEIYLIGVDCSYGAMGSEGNHFYKQEDKVNYPFYSDMVQTAYSTALAYASSHGIKIYNATRGGKLEVFERVDFDSLF